MNKLLLALAVVFIGAVAGWYAFGTGGGVNLPKLTDFTGTGKTTAPVSPTPAEDSGSLYRYTEVPAEVPPAEMPDTKGGEITLPGTTVTPAVVSPGVVGTISGTAKVEYLDGGFSPQIVTVKLNTAVTFVNLSSNAMWVASNPHPSHDLLPDFDQKETVIKNGTYSYTFKTIGTWIYHNHVNPEHTGTIIVKK